METLWEKQLCPAATTQCLVPDYCGESFTCRYSGRCISQSLRCNGDFDCDDSSDEEDCAQLNLRTDKCSTLLSIPGADRGTQGYNILSDELMDPVLDPAYFGGQCEYIYNGEWRKFGYDAFCESLHYKDDEKNYRKPYNYHTYRIVAEATSEGTHEYYNDLVSLLRARNEKNSFNLGVTFGVMYVEAGLKGSQESEFLTNMTKFKSQDLGFIRLSSKVQTAQFKMRSSKLMLHEDFYIALMDLPEEYNFGMYSRIFSTFGTHYVTDGTMGGTLEYVLVVNKTAMAHSNVEAEQIGRCFGGSLGLSGPLGKGVSAKLKVSGEKCGTASSYDEERGSDSALVQDVVTKVKGGYTDTSSTTVAIRNPETYRKWGASLKYNPALIEYNVMPLYELVRISTAADHVGARLAHLQTAWDEFMQQFHSCRCVPCRHNGIPVLTGTSCSCLCREGYQGLACQETLRRDLRTDGSWSCWGPWSACTSGKRQRSRACNNPAPDAGGANCIGSSSQTHRC